MQEDRSCTVFKENREIWTRIVTEEKPVIISMLVWLVQSFMCKFSLAALISYLEFCLSEPLPSHFGKKK